MQTNAMKACSYIAECSLSFTKIMQGEHSSKAGKRSFTRLDIAEPKLIFCKIICLTTNVWHRTVPFNIYSLCRSETLTYLCRR